MMFDEFGHLDERCVALMMFYSIKINFYKHGYNICIKY
jgi:hypothetical protein